ncbi:MAG: hypothetical protein J6M53_02705 [Bacteroidaceae bacterium]|nr:hypothetical protein [Bacteroidaceae bacterium]
MLAALCALLTDCSEVDCPLNNVVAVQYGLYRADGTSVTLTDRLTVTALGTDSVLLNQAQGVSSFLLPVHYTAEADTLVLTFADDEGDTLRDTLVVGHTNETHFEAMDCPLCYFHTLTALSATSHALERAELVYPQVNYDTQENIRLYLRDFIE